MPSTTLHTLSPSKSEIENPLPPLLQTPAGLAIIEIQGSLHTPTPTDDVSMTNIGKLVFPLYDPGAPLDNLSWMKKVYLYVGRHQRLTGEIKTLGKDKCIGVVRKREGSSDEGLEIVDVVRYKIVFQSRPEPVDMIMNG